MPIVPAFCDDCGAIFSSGIVAENALHIQFSNCRSGPCPNCGGMGHVPDGIFNFIGNAIEFLSGPTRSADELQKLATLLKNVQKEQISLEEFSTTVSNELSELGPITKLLTENRNDLYQIIIILLMLIQILLSGNLFKKDSFSGNERDQLIWQAVEKSYSKKKVDTYPNKEVGRNEPCYCGSGIKYKKCHGKNK